LGTHLGWGGGAAPTAATTTARKAPAKLITTHVKLLLPDLEQGILVGHVVFAAALLQIHTALAHVELPALVPNTTRRGVARDEIPELVCEGHCVIPSEGRWQGAKRK
jgi:hypothetical protein